MKLNGPSKSGETEPGVMKSLSKFPLRNGKEIKVGEKLNESSALAPNIKNAE